MRICRLEKWKFIGQQHKHVSLFYIVAVNILSSSKIDLVGCLAGIYRVSYVGNLQLLRLPFRHRLPTSFPILSQRLAASNKKSKPRSREHQSDHCLGVFDTA